MFLLKPLIDHFFVPPMREFSYDGPTLPHDDFFPTLNKDQNLINVATHIKRRKDGGEEGGFFKVSANFSSAKPAQGKIRTFQNVKPSSHILVFHQKKFQKPKPKNEQHKLEEELQCQ